MQFPVKPPGSGGDSGGFGGADTHAVPSGDIGAMDAGEPFRFSWREASAESDVKADMQLGRRDTDCEPGNGKYSSALNCGRERVYRMECWILAALAGLLLLNVILCATTVRKKRRRQEWLRKQELLEKTGLWQETAAALESTFQRFLPAELLEMMGIQDSLAQPSDILEGQKELQAVILNGNIAGFQELIHDMETREVYRLVNQSLAFSIPVVFEKNGMISRFQDAGIEALFTNRMEEGLDAAISICEEMIKLGEWEKYKNFTIGLCYGRVSLGVVGYGTKLSVLTLSTYTGLGSFLQKSAPKYYARILAAGSYLEKVEGFEKNYNHRFLGLFYIRDIDSAEKIFDVFDGDEAGVRNRKRKTRMLFERGAGLFIDRQFAEARGYFIEVLKADRDDRAAREYVFLCDRYGGMSTEQAAKTGIYIESY